MTRGIVFDCDGVLVDSEPLSNRLLARMLTEIGLPTSTSAAMENYMGGSTAAVVADVERRLGGPLPAGFLDEFARRSEACFAEELRTVPGIEEALDRIDVPWCVASSGSHEKIRFTLGLTGLLPRFDGRIFSSADVDRSKPAPDLFLHAAAAMGFRPDHTVVVEDTPRGVRAGVAAGMAVLAYADNVPARELQEVGGRVFDDMADLPRLIDETLSSPGGGAPP